MKRLVLKFGGTSVGSIENIRKVVTAEKNIKQLRGPGNSFRQIYCKGNFSKQQELSRKTVQYQRSRY